MTPEQFDHAVDTADPEARRRDPPRQAHPDIPATLSTLRQQLQTMLDQGQAFDAATKVKLETEWRALPRGSGASRGALGSLLARIQPIVMG